MIPRGTVVVRGDRIAEVGVGDLETGTGEEAGGVVEIDAAGRYVAPGLIHIHVHGGGGHDFMDGTVEAFLGVAVYMPDMGRRRCCRRR